MNVLLAGRLVVSFWILAAGAEIHFTPYQFHCSKSTPFTGINIPCSANKLKE
jgi:hypothetical protein